MATFDIEAEEYAEKHTFYDEVRERHRYDVPITQIFKDAAKVGYNKANEWHKQEVDDVYDLISEDWSVRYFICIMKDKSRVTAFGNCDEGCNGEVSVNLFFDYEDEKYCMDDIVWWKEIVLPKENE